VSSPYAGLKKRSTTAVENVVVGILNAIEQSTCSAEDKLAALRCISSELVLSPAQAVPLFQVFPDPEVHNASNLDNSLAQNSGGNRRKKITRMETNRLDALGVTQRKSAFQWKFQKCRVEAFVSLFNRCIEPQMLCTPDCLYKETLFGSDGVAEVCHRLGRIRTFDALHCSESLSHIRPSTSLSGESRLARTLKLLKDAKQAEEIGDKDVFLRGVTPQFGRIHELTLSTYEDWVCATFLLQLSRSEKGDNLKNCYWSGQDESCAAEGRDFLIPQEWFKQVPKIGELQVTYVTQRPESINLDARRTLAEKLFGWDAI